MIKKTIFIIVLTVSMITMAFAQWQGRNRANRVHTFDVTAPVDITGKITKVETVTNGKGRRGSGIHLTVADGDKQLPIRLGPSAYLDSNRWEFKEGENITVKAFKGTGNDNGVFFASQITRNGEQLTLRDQNGFPKWSRGMNGQRMGANRTAGRRGCGNRFNR